MVWVGGGLGANFAWEMLQMPLYGKFQGGWWRCFQATLGDVVILAVLYCLMACAAESWLWFRRLSAWRQIALAAMGFLVAVVIELQALAEGRWNYEAAMPLVPLFEVGWLPVLQMIVIPLGLAWLSRAVIQKSLVRRET
jgi:hypothetical protein